MARTGGNRMEKGTRVELHPATDAWMSGDRYGEIIGKGNTREYVNTFTHEHEMLRPWRVKLDKSGRIVRFVESDLSEIW